MFGARVWNKNEDDALRAGWYNPRITAEDIADVLLLTVDSIKHRARKLGLEKANRGLPPRLVSSDSTTASVWVPGAGGQIVSLDNSDLKWFLTFPGGWYIHKRRTNHYVLAKADPNIRLHRLIVKASDDQIVDHANGNGLDNRRANLRLASNQQNCQNSKHPNKTAFKCVWRHVSGRYGGAVTAPNGKRVSIGYYDDAYSAARASDAVCALFHGEFARLNLPDDRMSNEEIMAHPSLTKIFSCYAPGVWMP